MDTDKLKALVAQRHGVAERIRTVSQALRDVPRGGPGRAALVQEQRNLEEKSRLLAQSIKEALGDEPPRLREEQRSIQAKLLGMSKQNPARAGLVERERVIIARLTEIGRIQAQPNSKAAPAVVAVSQATAQELAAARAEVDALKLRLQLALQEASDARLALLCNQEATKPLHLRISMLEAALEASRSRRAMLLDVCRLLLAAEDDARLTEKQYDIAMDKAVKLARTAQSLEFAANAGTVRPTRHAPARG